MVYIRGKNCGWLKWLKLARCCSLLPKSLACLNRISVYAYWHYAFSQVFTLCWHPTFVFSTSTRCNQLEKLGMCKLYCNCLLSKIDSHVLGGDGAQRVISPSIVRIWTEQLFKWKHSWTKSTWQGLMLCLAGSCLFSSPVLKKYSNIYDLSFPPPEILFPSQYCSSFACLGGKYCLPPCRNYLQLNYDNSSTGPLDIIE